MAPSQPGQDGVLRATDRVSALVRVAVFIDPQHDQHARATRGDERPDFGIDHRLGLRHEGSQGRPADDLRNERRGEGGAGNSQSDSYDESRLEWGRHSITLAWANQRPVRRDGCSAVKDLPAAPADVLNTSRMGSSLGRAAPRPASRAWICGLASPGIQTSKKRADHRTSLHCPRLFPFSKRS